MPRLLQRGFAAATGLALLLAPMAPRALAQTSTATHEVQPGETLWLVADAAGTDVATLMALNSLEDGDLIYAGMSLRLPDGGSISAVTAPPAPVTHVVEASETLWSIAQRYGTSVDRLVAENGLETPDAIMVGTELAIPAASAEASVARTTAAPTAVAIPAAVLVEAASAPDGASVGQRTLFVPYTVQPGETLAGIARQFGVDVHTVAEASGVQDANLIAVGAILRVPLPSREYVIQPKDTLYGIAAREQVDLGSLIDLNEITDTELIRVGQVLAIPSTAQMAAAASGGSAGAAPAPASTPEPAAAATPEAPLPTLTLAVATVPPLPAAPTATSAPAATATPQPRATVAIPPGTPREGIVGEALKLIGMPYVFGGSGPSSFDCSGFVWYVLKQVGTTVSRGLFAQYEGGAHPGRDALQPGDLVFFQNTYMRGLSHNGIYIGNGNFIHAADERSGVTISPLGSEYWSTRYFGATRVP